jgi:putative spermidine/putrescine transport system permease protein
MLSGKGIIVPQLDRRIFLLLPAIGLVCVLFVYPVGALLLSSATDPHLGLQNYAEIARKPLYAAVIWNTVAISALVTLVCILVGYPFAYSIAAARPAVRRYLIFAVLVPFWSSVLVRSFAWLVLLQRDGLVNKAIIWLGLSSTPLTLVHNRIGVLVGMSHVLLPFMVLPLYSVMARIDGSLLLAAGCLGAPPLRAFLRVYLPLTYPGLLNGTGLVFVLGLGYFIVPALLGGLGDTMVAQVIQSQIADFGRWGVAGALSVVLLIAVAVIFAILRRSISSTGSAF